MDVRLLSHVVTLKDVVRPMAVILRYFTAFGSFWANYCTMFEVSNTLSATEM